MTANEAEITIFGPLICIILLCIQDIFVISAQTNFCTRYVRPWRPHVYVVTYSLLVHDCIMTL